MDWNRIAEMVDSDGLSQTRKPYQGSNSPCIVLGCNQTGSRIEMGMALVLGGLQITPLDDEGDFLSGSVYNLSYSGDGILGVALQPLEPGGIGPVVVSGHVPVMVNVSDSTHQYAVPSGNGYLNSAEDGPVRLSYTNSSTGLVWCNALLGTGESAGGAYDGPFKMGEVVDDLTPASSSSAPEPTPVPVTPFYPLPAYIEDYHVRVGAGNVYNTHQYRASDIWWQWAGGLVSLPAIDTSHINIPADKSYSAIVQEGYTKEKYLSDEWPQHIATVSIRTSATGPMLEALDYLEPMHIYKVADIGYVNAVVGWIDDPEHEMVRGAVKRLKSEQLWKYGESLNGVFTVGNSGRETFPDATVLFPTSPGLYIYLYDGVLGAWPVSDTEIMLKGGDFPRRMGTTGTTTALPTTTIADTIVDASTQGLSFGTIFVMPYQEGVSVRVSGSAAPGAIFAIGQYSYDSVNSQITAWTPSTCFRISGVVGANYQVVNYSGGSWVLGVRQSVMEVYDDTGVVFYHYSRGWHADTYLFANCGNIGALYWTNGDRFSTGTLDGGFMTKAYTQIQTGDIGGYTTLLAYWNKTGATDETVYIWNQQPGTSISTTTVPDWAPAWRADGGIDCVGGRLDFGWDSLLVTNATYAVPSTGTTHYWLEVTYTPGSSGATGTVSASFNSGSSIPSSTATMQVMVVGSVSVGSDGFARISEGNNSFLDDGSLARYSTAILIMRCL